MTQLSQAALDQLFLNARTANGFLDTPIAIETLHEIYHLARMGATSMNNQPARYIVLATAEAKNRLLPAMSAGNLDKTKSAPVTVIVGIDLHFHEQMGRVFPHFPAAKEMFTNNEALRLETAHRNGDPSKLFERGYRFSFDEACQVL